MRSSLKTSLQVRLKYREEGVRIRKWQGTQQHCVHNTEDGSVGANAERECDSGDDADARRLEQHAEAKANVLEKCVHEFVPSIADCRLPIANLRIHRSPNRQSAIGNRQCFILPLMQSLDRRVRHAEPVSKPRRPQPSPARMSRARSSVDRWASTRTTRILLS